MRIATEQLSQPVLITATIDSEELKTKKEEYYKVVKKTLPKIKGFREGKHIPRDVAESHFGIETLYKDLIDKIYYEIADKCKVVSNSEFKMYGDFKDTSALKIEFIAEVEPEVNIVDLSEIDIQYSSEVKIDDNEIEEILKRIQIENKSFENIEKEFVENLDIVEIDFKGVLEGEKKPFKGGTVKGHCMTVDIEHKSFIDDFEKQILGMKKNETKEIKVTFPNDYRDKSKAGKKAVFKTTLLNFKKTNIPNFDVVAKLKGFDSVDKYKNVIKENILEKKKRDNEDQLKKDIVGKLYDKSNMTPIPIRMVDNEINKEWEKFLNRIGKTEEEYLKENYEAKELFISNNRESSKEVVRTMLILQAVANKYKITVSKEEVEEYIMNIINALKYDEKKKKIILKDLENKHVYDVQEKSVRNEKTIDFLVNYFKSHQYVAKIF